MAEPSGNKKSPLTLHHLTSSRSSSVLWMLEELAETSGLQYNLKVYKRVKSRAPDTLKAVHPLGKSPTLTIDADADAADQKPLTITETRIILQYIADHYSNGIWTPRTAEDKARDAFWQEFASSTLVMKNSLTLTFEIVPLHTPWLFRPLASAIFLPIANVFKREMPDIYRLLEEALSDEKPWFAGEKIGLADFVMSFPIDTAVARGYFEARKYPRVMGWRERVHARPAFKRMLEKGGSYDFVTFDLHG